LPDGGRLRTSRSPSALVRVRISPTSLTVECLARARDDRLRYDQPRDAGSNQCERERVFSNFSGKVAEELGCRILARIVCELID
jgi:hypothetical protein